MGLKILHANANVLMSSGLNAILSRGGGIDSIQNAVDEQSLFESLDCSNFDLVVIDCCGPFIWRSIQVILLKLAIMSLWYDVFDTGGVFQGQDA